MQEKYSTSSILNIQDIANKELEKFTLSSLIIRPARKEHKFVIIDSEDIIQEFQEFVKHDQFPKDQYLAVVLSALRTLKQPELAVQLFNLIEKRVNPSIKDEVIGPHSYTALSYLNIKELAKNKFEEFTISSFEIRPAGKKRKFVIGDSLTILEEFKDLISKHTLPKDESFAVVLSALRKLEQSTTAVALFDLTEKKINKNILDIVIGRYSYAALLQALRDILNNCSQDEKPTYLARIPVLENTCRQKKYMYDPYIANEFICIYADLDQFDLVEQMFLSFRESNVPDLPLHSKYITCLIKQNKLIAAEKELLPLVAQYNSLKSKKEIRPNDEHAVRAAYNDLIIVYYSTDLEKALATFKAAIGIGLYANNQLQRRTENGKDLVQLNFHLSEYSRQNEGGLPLIVAKVAFLYFIQQLSAEHVHFPAKVITGGRTEQQSKLKKEFPKYLSDEYGAEVKWNSDERILEFIIPYESLRKIKFVVDMLNGLEFDDLIHNYRSDLRRHNEGPNKPHSAVPKIPSYYDEFAYNLAKKSMDCYEKEDYGQCEKLRWQLVDYLPNDPWAYVQLGGVLHRNNKLDEAINCYKQAIQIIKESDPQDNTSLSDAYRKQGWAYDRVHRRTRAKTDLNQAIFCYSQALKIDPNNFEAYNNWGITLYRTKNYTNALKKFEDLHSLNPQHEEAYDHLGNCYRELKNYSEAEKYYEQGINLLKQGGKEKLAAYIYCDLGYLYLHQFTVEQDKEALFIKAKKAFETCIQLQITRDQAYTGLGDLHKLKKDQATAQHYYDLAKKYLSRNSNGAHYKTNDTQNDNNTSSSSIPPVKNFTPTQRYSHFASEQQHQSKQQLNNNNSTSAEMENVHKTVSTTAFDTSRMTYTDSSLQNNPFTKRDPLHAVNKIKTLLKSSSHIPVDFQLGTAMGQGDCFFDAVAQGLNQLTGKQECDVKSLRVLCETYAKEPSHAWVKDAILKDKDNYEQYLTRIAFTVEEMASAEWNITKDPAVWGRPLIEGRMICEQYDIRLHVIEILENEDQSTYVMEQLVTKQGSRSIESMTEKAYTDARTLHIVVYRNHFVPLLPKATYNAELKQQSTQFNDYSHFSPAPQYQSTQQQLNNDKSSPGEMESKTPEDKSSYQI